ncbi:helix-turn-helix transcriptional regulator [Streptomyces sp. NPDC060243]|uniref:helix-turn-helix transcriptional regulator n=1 Tax=Streptomyces sp. NPDC060243 TaxID=3347081 RepID=UPI00365BB050
MPPQDQVPPWRSGLHRQAGERLRARPLRCNRTQEGLAEDVGISRDTFQRIEAGRSDAGTSHLAYALDREVSTCCREPRPVLASGWGCGVPPSTGGRGAGLKGSRGGARLRVRLPTAPLRAGTRRGSWRTVAPPRRSRGRPAASSRRAGKLRRSAHTCGSS